MTWRYLIFALTGLTLVPCWVLGADGQLNEPDWLVRGQSPYRRDIVYRFGWWGTSTDGDLTKINEYQKASPSPFWDVDGLSSDRRTTLDFFASQLDEEAFQGGLYYYRPGLSADFEYERFFRRRDHDPLTNMGQFPDDSEEVIAEDLNIGEDYAIRVQELKADFKGDLSQNVKWRLNLWGIRKHGERQANAMSHCFDHPDIPGGARFCHVLSQRQQIDWLTMQIEPVLEGRFGPISVEYSRPMRAFSQDDQIVSRFYNPIGAGTSQLGDGPSNGVFPYAIVPENFTDIDKLKLSVDLTADTRFYSLLYHGNSHNKRRETDREFGGFDARLINHSFRGLTLTGYTSWHNENNEKPTFALPLEEEFPTPSDDVIRNPIEYTRIKAGLKGRWRPGARKYSSSGFSLRAGYEYRRLDRNFVTYGGPDPGSSLSGNPDFLDGFTQPDTVTHEMHIGPSMRWSPCLETYLRFRTRSISNPLFGVREISGDLNTSLPGREDLIEIGGTWTPARNFLLTGLFGIETSAHRSSFANFDEDNYPIVLTAWYAPTPCLSLSGGYAHYTNWIDQDITLGDTYELEGGDVRIPVTLPWNYGGHSDVVNVGASYAWTPDVRLLGQLEFVRAVNALDTPPAFARPEDPLDIIQWVGLPGASDVIVETIRMSAGVDVALTDRIDTYFRYVYFDYEDESVDFNSGTGHMFLGGLAASY